MRCLCSVNLLLVALWFLNACEPLRPEAHVRPAASVDGGLQKARELIQQHGSVQVISEQLRTVIESSDEPEDAEAAARLLLRTHLEWYQLAHISHDLLRILPGHNRVYNTLRDELYLANGDEPPAKSRSRKRPPGPAPKELQFIADLVGPGPGGVRGITVKRLLNARISLLEASSDPVSRALATTGRLFLNLEAGWRYSTDFRVAPQRIRDIQSLATRSQAHGLADNAWLMLQLAMDLSLQQPKIPNAKLAEAISVLLDEPIDLDAAPVQWLLSLGSGSGTTRIEQIHASWVTVNKRVNEALLRLSAGPSSDARRTYELLSRHLELAPPKGKATPAVLHAFCEPVRDFVVTHWLEGKKLSSPRSGRALRRIETALRGEWATQPARRPAILVMAVLLVQHALNMKFSTQVRGRALQLLDRGAYLRRSLILPGGRVSRSFPSNVQRCLERDTLNCLSQLVDTLQRMAIKKQSRPSKALPRPAKKRKKQKSPRPSRTPPGRKT